MERNWLQIIKKAFIESFVGIANTLYGTKGEEHYSSIQT
jgi:hypothetical protein